MGRRIDVPVGVQGPGNEGLRARLRFLGERLRAEGLIERAEHVQETTPGAGNCRFQAPSQLVRRVTATKT